MKARFITATSLVALAALALASPRAHAQEILTSKAPDREQQLIEGAKKEGQVVLYSAAIVNQALRPMAEAFMKKYPFVKVTYWRGGKTQDTTVTLGTLPSNQQLASTNPPATRNGNNAQTTTLSDFGLSLGRSQDNLGVMITNVDPNGQTASRGLQSGDVIVAVGDAMVASPRDVEQKIADAKAGGQKAVLLRVKSGDRMEFVALSFAT